MKHNSIFLFALQFLIITSCHSYNSFDLSGVGSVMPAYGKNINFLNDCNFMDKIFAVCYYVDVAGKYSTGYDPACPILEAKMLLKTQGTFAQDQFIAPLLVDHPVRFYETLLADHLHLIDRPIFWINELWMRIDLRHMLSLPFSHKQTITFGLFPFILGRGIALGYNNPDYQQRFFLLVPTFSIVNQYPPGILISGNLSTTLAYDIYGSTVDNKAINFSQTALLSKTDIYGHNQCGQRGFGAVHYYTAARLRWDPVACETESAHMEFYGVFNNNPLINNPFSNERPPTMLTDTRVENQLARIKSIGCAGEYVTGNWEFGFDTAKNFGYGLFLGIDTNVLLLTAPDGFLQDINNKVSLISTGEPAPATFENQLIINNSPQNQAQNGRPISPLLRNGFTRFRDNFTILMRGWMFIADAAYTLDKHWKVATTLGVASGGGIIEQITNNVIINNNFIGLQELYIGKRVVNAFFLNGSYSGSRPIDVPNAQFSTGDDFTRFGFTNMIFTGVAAHYATKLKEYPLKINPNLLCYWSCYPAKNYSTIPVSTVPRFYGTEFNIFAFLSMHKHLKWVGVLMLFFPGTFYKALRNQPILTSDFAYLQSIANGIPTNFTPLLGADPGLVINIGLEWSF